MAFETFPKHIARQHQATLMFYAAYMRDASDVAVTKRSGITRLAVGLSAFLTRVSASVFLTEIVTLETPAAEMVEIQKYM